MRSITFFLGLVLSGSPLFAQSDTATAFEAAMAHLDNGHLDEAMGIWETILNNNPRNYRAMTNLSRAYIDKGSFDRASNMLDSLLEFYPDSTQLYCRVGLLYEHQGKYRQAARAYAKSPHSHAQAESLELKARNGLPLFWRRSYRKLVSLAYQENRQAVSAVAYMEVMERNLLEIDGFPHSHYSSLTIGLYPDDAIYWFDDIMESSWGMDHGILDATRDGGDYFFGDLDILCLQLLKLTELAILEGGDDYQDYLDLVDQIPSAFKAAKSQFNKVEFGKASEREQVSAYLDLIEAYFKNRKLL